MNSQSQAVHSQTGFTLRRFNIDVDKGEFRVLVLLAITQS